MHIYQEKRYTDFVSNQNPERALKKNILAALQQSTSSGSKERTDLKIVLSMKHMDLMGNNSDMAYHRIIVILMVLGAGECCGGWMCERKLPI